MVDVSGVQEGCHPFAIHCDCGAVIYDTEELCSDCKKSKEDKVKKFDGDAQKAPLCDILKALGYAYKDCRYCNPKIGKKEIYKDDPKKMLVNVEDILFVGGATETWDWLVETGQVDGEKQRDWSVVEAYEIDRVKTAEREKKRREQEEVGA